MNSIRKVFIKNAIKVYQKSPLHPKIGPILAKLLDRFVIDKGIRVHDLGRFKINVDLQQFIDSQLYYLGVFEADVVKTIEKLVHPGDTVFDVGANIGYMTLNLAWCVGETGKVVAFEPSSWAFHRLERNIQLNGMHQVDAKCLGVSDISKKDVKLTLPCGYRLDGQNTANEEVVDICTLDDWVTEHGIDRLNFIKIDTDGMEAAIIRGALAILDRFRPAIIFELGPGNLEANDESSEDLLNSLLDINYCFFYAGTLQPCDDIKTMGCKLSGGDTINVVALPVSQQSEI